MSQSNTSHLQIIQNAAARLLKDISPTSFASASLIQNWF